MGNFPRVAVAAHEMRGTQPSFRLEVEGSEWKKVEMVHSHSRSIDGVDGRTKSENISLSEIDFRAFLSSHALVRLPHESNP